MAIEIERKFLLHPDIWKQTEKGPGQLYCQGYLLTGPDKTIRVRLTPTGAFLTIKGKTTGASRPEYEYPIPPSDARELLAAFCGGVIEKIRYRILYEGKLWEVDVFQGDNEGLLLAEIELSAEDENFTLPPFIAAEVTGQVEYYNAYLAQHPFSEWKH